MILVVRSNLLVHIQIIKMRKNIRSAKKKQLHIACDVRYCNSVKISD